MTFSYQPPTLWQRYLYRLLPSRTAAPADSPVPAKGKRYRPVPLNEIRLIAPVRRLLQAQAGQAPLSFRSDKRLTVIIPYRDRDEHLNAFIPAITQALTEQAIDYRILVVEQAGNALFNRGKLLNIGMHYAAEHSDYYCLHDVDAVPVQADYRCPSQPLRLINQLLSTHRPSDRLRSINFSGAISLSREQAFAANGFSNHYWGWGKEDDDFLFRLLLSGACCHFDEQGQFHDLPNPPHQQVRISKGDKPEHVRHNRARRSRLYRLLDNPADDGLSTLTYSILDRQQHECFEKITVRL
ncbi:galactosyltransferase-related protein [Gallaecimonas sp. GXIMD4217]|uniref:galactosyltransferase-related protein n=1 Tax=Gallaecimonas sp. GXIMD4217 TaxID=3131927 RepID=UPI00311AE695